MASESLKKVHEALFRGRVSTPPPESRADSVADPRPDHGLTIQIPNSIHPTPQKAPPQTNRKSSTDSLTNPKHKAFRTALQEKLGNQYRGAEKHRLEEDRNKEKHWKKWGPYVSDRQWVRVASFYRCLISIDEV
jgi:hypothetical protein